MKGINAAIKNSFAAVKRDIDEVKARSSLIDGKLRNSFSNIKKDMDSIKRAVLEVNATKDSADVNERLNRIDSEIKNNLSKHIKKLGLSSSKDFEGDLSYLKKSIEDIRGDFISVDDLNERLSQVESSIKDEFSKELGKNIPGDFGNELDDIKSELKALNNTVINKDDFENAIDSLKEELDIDSKLEEIEKKIPETAVKEVIKKVPASKKKDEKGLFTKMIDFFAED